MSGTQAMASAPIPADEVEETQRKKLLTDYFPEAHHVLDLMNQYEAAKEKAGTMRHDHEGVDARFGDLALSVMRQIGHRLRAARAATGSGK